MIFKQIKKIKRNFNKYLLLLIFFSLCLTIVCLKTYVVKNPYTEKAQRQISNVEELINSHTVPAGTPLIVPPWIQQQYLQQMAISQAMLGNNTLLDFLIHNYSVAAPSSTDEDEDTFYVPLLRSSYLDDDDDDDDYFSLTEYFDVTNTYLEKDSDPDKPVLITINRADTQINREHISDKAIRIEPIPTSIVSPEKSPEEAIIEDKSPEELSEESTLKEDTPSEELPEKPQTSDTESKLIAPTQIEKGYESRECNTSSQEEKTTEAVDSCTACHQNREKIIEGLDAIVTTVDKYKEAKYERDGKSERVGFPKVLERFCSTCRPVNIKNFIQYVTTRSKEKNIPPEIFFSIVMQESTGECTAKTEETPNEHSIGLMQMNKKSSTCLKECNSKFKPPDASDKEMQEACLNIKHRNICTDYFINKKTKEETNDCSDCQESQSSRNPNACLNNPYCGFEEALYLMGKKWKTGNGQDTPHPKALNWLNMNTNQRDRWRNAIISYNRADHMLAAEDEMKQNSEYAINDWEKKRVYFIKRNWLDEDEGSQKNIIGNIAYMERVTGREIPCGGENSIIMEWLNFIENNSSPDCSNFQ